MTAQSRDPKAKFRSLKSMMPEVFEEDVAVPPAVRRTPKYWPGENYDGVTYDQLPVNFLEYLRDDFLLNGKRDMTGGPGGGPKTFPSTKSGEEILSHPIRFRDAALADAWATINRERLAAEPQAAEDDEDDEATDSEEEAAEEEVGY